MPTTDGLSVAESREGLSPNTSFLVIPPSRPRDRRRGHELGAYDYITSRQLDEIKLIVRDALEAQAAARRNLY